MSFRVKLILVSVSILMLTVAVAGFIGYRESKWKIKDLARELLVAKTNQAFALCERHHKNESAPSDELRQEIAAIKIATNGYIVVLNNRDDPEKGTLLVHPSAVGKILYNESFPHIKEVLDQIDANGKINGDAGFTEYRQRTDARGMKGELKVAYYKYFAPWDWVILGTGYEKDVFASRDALRSTLIQVFLGVLFSGILVVFFIIRQMFKPIQRLTESTREVANGNWDISIDYKWNDEIGTLAQSFNNMVKSLRENARIWQEFKVARDMQARMLPKSFPEIRGFQINAKSMPAQEVGGDFYDFLPLEENKLGIVVGDVSGHGVSAAMVMTAAMSAVRFAAEERENTAEVLNMVNSRLSKDIQNHMFVALFYGIIDANRRQLRYTNAGQTMPYLWRQGKVVFLPQADASDRFPLGIVKDTVYEQLTFDLLPGDVLVFYTDGIVDEMNGHDESYGFERLSASIDKCAPLSPDQILDGIVSDMCAYTGNSSFSDDVTLVIVKVE